ncbi:MAG TPA: CoA protein activase [Bacillota bacterium]|nr:CoA protein activase [Bacillota bacterium]
MLKVTFPHIGNSYIPFRTLLMELGVEPVIPPPITQRTISLGTQIAPEFACFPLKINLGNYIETMEKGAEMILMAGGVGPCRFGYYGEVQREILQDAGYEIDFLVLEAPKTHPRELWEKIKRIFPCHQPHDLIRALRKAWIKADLLDQFDRLANHVRARELKRGQVSQLQARFYHQLDQAVLLDEIQRVARQFMEELKDVPTRKDEQPLRVRLVGEIYMVLEPNVNFHIERVLGEMGVDVERTIYFTDWVKDTLLKSIYDPNWRAQMLAVARPYLKNFVGGHGLETVAHTVEAGVNRYDGVIQLAPFTCMPEIVAMQALPAVSQDLDIPYLTLIIDEHAAEAGIMTRLEAFIDLLSYQRNSRGGGKTREVVSGY